MAHAMLGHPRVLFVLFFCSGMGALILEILWLRKLSVVLGSTAYAAATTLSVFFLGIAVGGRLWGSASRALSRPLRSYALLEIGVALAAAAAWVLLSGLDRLYQPLFAAFGEQRLLLVAARALLAAAVLIVPTVLMGGTFPLMAQRVVGRRDVLGVTGGRLYATNTLGASAGALLAGFYLVRWWGVTASYFAAVGLLAAVGVVAYAGGRDEASLETDTTGPSSPGALPSTGGYAGTVVAPKLVLAVALFSGLATLALEVLWTRMFSLVLHNSVYSFSLILFMFLIALSGGAYLASRLAQLPHRPLAVLSWLAAGTGVTVVASIWVFFAVTDGLTYIAQTADWNRYLLAVLGTGILVMLVPATLAGTLFPYLLKIEERGRTSVGWRVGRLVAANALGAVVGPLIAGFVLLETVGIWGSVALVGAAYGGLAGVVAARAWGRAAGTRVLTGAAVLAAIALVARSRLPTVRTVPGEQVHATWQGSDGVVAVVQQGDNLILKLNNSYVLGDTRSALVEQMQAHIPLLLHPNPESVFFVGLGTGITAGAALAHPVGRVVAAELVPEVVDAAKRYFGDYVNGLFTDSRARVIVEDGRNLLRGLPDLYDVIVGDLFTPWHAGAGSMYTVEHFRTVRERLAPGGLFAQWLPMYQLSEAEFFIIARTMTEVFPQVTVWRADFAPARPSVALVGRVTNAPLDNAVLTANAHRLFATPADSGSGEHQAGLFYAGNLGANKALFADAVVNSDERPVIEYLAPVAERHVASRTGSRLVGEALADLFARLLEGSPPDLDPVLARLPATERRYVAAGLALYEYRLYEETGQVQRSKTALRRLGDALPADLVARLVGEGVGKGQGQGQGKGEEGRS